MRQGVPLRATIVERKEVPGRPPTYLLTYEFQPPTPTGERPATPVRAQMAVEQAAFHAAAINEHALVLYDPRAPQRSVLYRYADYQVIGPAVDAVRRFPASGR